MRGYEQRKTISAQFRVENRQGPQGTWQMVEGPKGEPMLMNTVSGEVKPAPAGIAQTGTFAKTIEPAQQAINHAEDYARNPKPTGVGDEALMEKFFELAKPSTGFRMSQPQINMLKQAQNWKNSAAAYVRHATTGAWFSDDQRSQIVDTMRALAKAKGISADTSGGAGGGGTGTWGDQFGVKPR